MDDHGSPVLAHLIAALPGAVRDTHALVGDATACVEPGRIVELMRFLRDDETLRFEMLADLTAVDFPHREPRFEVVYHLYSIEKKHRVRIKAPVSASDCVIDSICEVWPSANWLEREVFDMYGIRFAGHPDLRRLLLYDEFEGHPLRKDYPKERRQPLVGPRN